MKKIFLLLIFVLIFILAYFLGLKDYLSFYFIHQNLNAIQNYYQTHPVFTSFCYFIIYILITGLSLPGAALMTLLGGAVFGIFTGTLLISFASTFGATFAFLLSRYFLKDWVQRKFQRQLQTINEGIEKEGAFYLFTLRLIPLFPFFLINLVMGLTPLKTKTFAWISQLGMLLGTIAYVNAGKELAEITSLKGILSPTLLLSFSFIGLLPFISKKILSSLRKKKVYKPFKKPKKFDYNMIVIGGGAAGLVTSYISAAVKAKVALVEKNKMGGDCLNTGCVPSKAFIHSAKIAHLTKNNHHFSFSDVMKRVHQIIKKIEPHDSVKRYTKLGVDCFQEKATILSPFEVQIGEKTFTTQNITIATGASPFIPSIPGIEKVSPLTSENLWKLQEFPRKLLILGGGPIGCELAQAFQRLGSRVTLVDRNSSLLKKEDSDVSSFIQELFIKEGITLHLGTKPKEFLSDSTLLCESGEKIIFDHVLIATGRSPRTKGFGLEKLGIPLRANGTIETNEYLQTLYPNIFACGDVTGPYQFTHTASHQAWYCAVNGLFRKFKKFKVDDRVIPWCTYTDPEIAQVGLNEKEAKSQHIPYEVTTYNLSELDRAITDGVDQGFIKVLTIPKKDTILGATIVGHHASTMISEFILAMKYNLGLNKILGTIHIYPSLGEANKYLAGNWKKNHKPKRLLNWMRKFHQRRLNDLKERSSSPS